ncbi:MAG: hypothetical protein R3338_14675 [Thermoanaerobaculia bacterium]|nr:hypothetical protein [Thermoanaerobaculia bacterium]
MKGQLRGVPSFIAIVAVVWLGLRVLHFVIPAAQPDVLTGPFELGSLSEIEAIVGFEPLVPAYHPVSLGNEPIRIVAKREPSAEVTIMWRGDRLLEVVERPAGAPFDLPVDAEPLSDRDGWWSWRRGGAIQLRGARGSVDVEIRTNLSRESAARVVSTLVPLSEVR